MTGEREKERRHEGERNSSNGERGVVARRHVERPHSLRNCSPAIGRHFQVHTLYTYPTMPPRVAGESEEITKFSLSFLSTSAKLEIFSLDLAASGLALPLAGAVESPLRSLSIPLSN